MIVKEELYAKLDGIYSGRIKSNELADILNNYRNLKKSRQECLGFIKSIIPNPDKDKLGMLVLQLTTEESSNNCMCSVNFIESEASIISISNMLAKEEKEFLEALKQYICEHSQRIGASELADRIERQVYLRRAVSRLQETFDYSGEIPLVITKEQWPDVEPNKEGRYLNYSLQEQLDKTFGEPGCGINRPLVYRLYWGSLNLHKPRVILSVKSWIEYLDTFLEY